MQIPFNFFFSTHLLRPPRGGGHSLGTTALADLRTRPARRLTPGRHLSRIWEVTGPIYSGRFQRLSVPLGEFREYLTTSYWRSFRLTSLPIHHCNNTIIIIRSSALKMEAVCSSAKRWYLPTTPHGVTVQKTNTDSFIKSVRKTVTSMA
jgi:hypothetical protein